MQCSQVGWRRAGLGKLNWGSGQGVLGGLGPYHYDLSPQGCYEKVKIWFEDNKHVLGTVGMCILIMQVRGIVKEERGGVPEQVGGPASKALPTRHPTSKGLSPAPKDSPT